MFSKHLSSIATVYHIHIQLGAKVNTIIVQQFFSTFFMHSLDIFIIFIGFQKPHRLKRKDRP